MDFREVINGLKEGKMYCRKSWHNLIIYKANENDVPESVIPKMTSLPVDVKNLAHNHGFLFLSYRAEVKSLNLSTTVVKPYNPDWEDIFAEDWEECNTMTGLTR